MSWALPLSLACLVFFLSSQSSLPMSQHISHPWDWGFHALGFALLVLSADWAWIRSCPHTPRYRRHLWIFGLTVLFGVSDEWHQSFVPGREVSALDLLADALGAGLGLTLSCLPTLWRRSLSGASWWRGSQRRPNPARDLILVADPHWGSELTGLRETTERHPKADWLFLGDVFDVWVGLPGMGNHTQQRFLAWVQERRATGAWVGLWMGNREYFLDGLHRHFDYIGEGSGGGLPDEKLAFEHGDLVNGQDRLYRLWNLLSRSGPVWLLVRLLPAASARHLATRLEQSMRTTNLQYRLAFPREAFAAAVRETPEGWTFVTGHFHSLDRVERGVSLPWAHEGQFWVWRQGRLEPLSTGSEESFPAVSASNQQPEA